MKLTPIKVKGKKGQGKARAAAGPQHTGILKPQRGRDATGGNDSDDGRRRRRLRPRNLVAPIEQLPSEILERIVFMSMNLNLLRSSHRIGRRFSSRSFFTELLECALSPTWDQWFGCPQREMQSYHGHLRDYERFAGNPNFQVCCRRLPNARMGIRQQEKSNQADWRTLPPPQSAVLACPWVDITLILEAQQKWYRRHGAGRYFQHDSGPEGGDPGHAAGGFDHAKDVAACFERDWNEFLRECRMLLNTVALLPVDDRDMHYSFRLAGENGPRYFDVHPLTRIPERLLTGPLDWEKAKQLFWLIRGGASLEPANAWEVGGHSSREGSDCVICCLTRPPVDKAWL